MAVFSIPNVKLSGIAAAVPKQIEYNNDLDFISDKEKNLLIKSVGINSRRVAPNGLCSSDLCEASAAALIKGLNWNKEDINVLVFISQTPDYITPATAVLLQNKLGLSESCMAFDVNLGCSAYPYGLSVVSGLLSNMKGGKALLLVGDISTTCISPNDKSTVPIFSDAGSATALEFDDKAEPFYFNLQNDGSQYQAIIIPEGGYRHPFQTDSLVFHEISDGISRRGIDMILNGIDVFNFSVTNVPKNITHLLDSQSITETDLDYVVLHQANKVINDAIAKKLKLTQNQCPSSLWDFGNTGSTTIPITMVTQLNNALPKSDLRLVLCGFGVGVSWGSALIKTSNVLSLPLIEV